MTADHDPAFSSNVVPPSGYRYAGPWIRFGALVIDGFLLWAVFAGLAIVIPNGVIHLNLNVWVVGAVAFGVTIGLILGWFGGWQAAVGATPGMLLLGLRVRDPSGQNNPSLVAAVTRNSLQWIVPGLATVVTLGDNTISEVLGQVLSAATTVLYIVIGVSISRSPTRQGIHDRLAGGTYVVRPGPASTSTL